MLSYKGSFRSFCHGEGPERDPNETDWKRKTKGKVGNVKEGKAHLGLVCVDCNDDDNITLII